MSVVVRRATAAEVRPLRQAVLRPGQPASASVYPVDEGSVHIGAWDGEILVGTATVFPEAWPGGGDGWAGAAPEPRAWRLRGMAVDPSRQRGGVGRVVLAAAVEAAREANAPLMWANARTAALPFYEAMGWLVAGEEFVTPDTGLPHKPIVLAL